MLNSMLSLLNTLIAFIVALLVLVSLHELGHFVVARLCGVKVLRFCIGFGKPLWSRKKGDTEWAIAPIPLGGYVKMVDTREGTVSPEDLPFAFDKQHPAKRIAIVVAGPLTNLVLAIFLFAISFSMGVTSLKPIIGMVEPNSIASRAGFLPGDTIKSINNETIKEWSDAQSALLLSTNKNLNIAVVDEAGASRDLVIDVAKESAAVAELPNKLSIGIAPNKITLNVAQVSKGGAADKAGLKQGDKLLAVGEEPITDWFAWKKVIENAPGAPVVLTYERDKKQITQTIYPDSRKEVDGKLVGFIGLAPSQDMAWIKKNSSTYTPNIGQAFVLATEKTYDIAAQTLSFFGKMIVGQASFKYVSGPVAIADIAGKTAKDGLQSYLGFLALVSVSLGVLNLLPIPILDGGHLLYYTVEWIRGKPLSARVQELGFRFGLAAMLCLMLLAFFNDFTRYFG